MDVLDMNPQATPEMCLLCFDALILKLHQQSRGSVFPSDASDPLAGMPLLDPSRYRQVQCPLFVTWDIWRRGRWELRGCIGSLQPLPLDRGVTRYALTSALDDRRFRRVSASEIPLLRVKVSLLVQYEPCEHVYDWVVGIHGIMIEWTEETPSSMHANTDPHSTVNNGFADNPANKPKPRRYSATYLPEVANEQGWSPQQAVESLIRKAGYQAPVVPSLLQRIKCTRYQSSKFALDFAQYCAIRKEHVTSNSFSNPHALQAYQTAVAAVAGGGSGDSSCSLM